MACLAYTNLNIFSGAWYDILLHEQKPHLLLATMLSRNVLPHTILPGTTILPGGRIVVPRDAEVLGLRRKEISPYCSFDRRGERLNISKSLPVILG
ncbi:hypothetical protein Krac_4584 [Ktedonobacter racemifer DSM 44963]|uniref:Uncharacterized protein n=1 Tax=Ktedonobacter racemifer DSM 44963 TaxID=485913 RepID=D6TT46_KTERA|nr:hypothetical protein Krac_4584 [Ktedonobacter racemifer DSM 44963]